MDSIETEVISKIKDIIAEKGLKKKHVAGICGYTERQFSNMINGRKKIDAEDLYKISTGLNVTPNELLGIHSNNKTA